MLFPYKDLITELQKELETKDQKIDDFALKAGINLSGSVNTNSIVGNTIGNMTGNMVAGNSNSIGEAQQINTDKIIDAIKALKQGINVDLLCNLTGMDKNLLTRIDQALK